MSQLSDKMPINVQSGVSSTAPWKNR